jgi:hypothetical protein
MSLLLSKVNSDTMLAPLSPETSEPRHRSAKPPVLVVVTSTATSAAGESPVSGGLPPITLAVGGYLPQSR